MLETHWTEDGHSYAQDAYNRVGLLSWTDARQAVYSLPVWRSTPVVAVFVCRGLVWCASRRSTYYTILKMGMSNVPWKKSVKKSIKRKYGHINSQSHSLTAATAAQPPAPPAVPACGVLWQTGRRGPLAATESSTHSLLFCSPFLLPREEGDWLVDEWVGKVFVRERGCAGRTQDVLFCSVVPHQNM